MGDKCRCCAGPCRKKRAKAKRKKSYKPSFKTTQGKQLQPIIFYKQELQSIPGLAELLPRKKLSKEIGTQTAIQTSDIGTTTETIRPEPRRGVQTLFQPISEPVPERSAFTGVARPIGGTRTRGQRLDVLEGYQIGSGITPTLSQAESEILSARRPRTEYLRRSVSQTPPPVSPGIENEALGNRSPRIVIRRGRPTIQEVRSASAMEIPVSQQRRIEAQEATEELRRRLMAPSNERYMFQDSP